MKCPKCQTENKDGAKFCLECGNKFEIRCPQCGRPVPLSAKFCDECGHKFSKPEQAPPPPSLKPSQIPRYLAEKILTARSALEGERNQVTVLFADLKGSMELIARCHLGLGKLYRRDGKLEQADDQLTSATTMFRNMEMGFWLEKAEAEMKDLSGRG